MEIRPVITPGRPYIERYGPGGFKISGAVFTGAVLILPDAAQAWPVSSMAELTPESLAPVGIVVDAMDTGAACRTYNVLVAEERRVAAALLPLTATG
jgi:uncharacterized protein